MVFIFDLQKISETHFYDKILNTISLCWDNKEFIIRLIYSDQTDNIGQYLNSQQFYIDRILEGFLVKQIFLLMEYNSPEVLDFQLENRLINGLLFADKFTKLTKKTHYLSSLTTRNRICI